MSNFSGVISNEKKPKSPIDEKLTFADLDTIVTWLLNETEQLSEDFNTKCVFANEQQQSILKNEHNLEVIHDQVSKLNESVAAVERTVQENDVYINELERCVNGMAHNILERDNLNCSICAGKFHNKHEEFLNQLTQTNVLMEKLTTMLDDMFEFEEYMQLQRRSPYFNIIAVLDWHVQALQQIDVTLNSLVDKADSVDQLLVQALEKIAQGRKFRRLPVNIKSNNLDPLL